MLTGLGLFCRLIVQPDGKIREREREDNVGYEIERGGEKKVGRHSRKGSEEDYKLNIFTSE